jgi:ribose transport system permease protein
MANENTLLSRLFADYGMLVVLAVLAILFTCLTYKEQHPTGDDAGRQVAGIVQASRQGPLQVLIVARNTTEDREFTEAAREQLETTGIEVVAVVNGEPRDVRMAVERLFAAGQAVDLIVANNVAAKWTVYERFEELQETPRVTPRPYYGADFLKYSNLIGVANQTAIYAIIAIGMTMVIVTAGIDLSVGSLVALAAVSSALFVREFGGVEASTAVVLAGMFGGILVCCALGAFNGVMVTLFQLPPFIVTLAMMMMASGMAFRLSGGRSIPELPAAFFALGGGRVMGVPNPVWLMVGLYVVGHVLMSRTVLGRYIYAIGGNEEAARLSGVPVKRTLLAVYTVCGALAGLGGVVLASQLAAGDPKFGDKYELHVIAAVVVGGTSLMGGQGKVLGTLIGAFIIAVIKNGMNLTDVDPFNQKIVLGGVLLLGVLIDTLKRRPEILAPLFRKRR